MFPLWATTMLALFLLLFSVPVAAIAVAIWVRLIVYLLIDLYDMNLEQLFGDVLAVLFFGTFATIIGWGAFAMGSTVIDGLIGRYVEYFTG